MIVYFSSSIHLALVEKGQYDLLKMITGYRRLVTMTWSPYVHGLELDVLGPFFRIKFNSISTSWSSLLSPFSCFSIFFPAGYFSFSLSTPMGASFPECRSLNSPPLNIVFRPATLLASSSSFPVCRVALSCSFVDVENFPSAGFSSSMLTAMGF